MTEEQPQNYDEDRERLMRFVRFAGFFIVLMIVWYSIGLADVV